MSKNELDSNFEKIVDFVKEEPRSQKEIVDKIFGGDESKYQLIKKHLDRAVRLKIIGYIKKGNPAKTLLMQYYEKEWILGTHRYYIYTPQSEELHKKLSRRFSSQNKGLIDHILNLYRLIEIAGLLNEISLTDKKIIKADLESESDGKYFSDEEIESKIKKAKKNINIFYNADRKMIFPFHKMKIGEGISRIDLEKQWQKLVNIFQMPPFMHAVAYSIPKVPDYAKDNPNKSVYETYTLPMYEKISRLFMNDVNERNSRKNINTSTSYTIYS